MKSDTWLPLYVNDFLGATMHLTNSEAGAYLLLLMSAWIRGAKLPDDDAQLARLARCSMDEWSIMKPVLAPFFTIENGFWIQHRLLKEKEIADHRSRVRTETGRLGGRPKSGLMAKPIAKPIANLLGKQNESPSPSPSQYPSGTRTPFCIPTIEAVKTRALEVGLPEAEAGKFFAHYESNGWKVGRNPMKSWKAAITNWKLNYESGTYARNNEKSGQGVRQNTRNNGTCEGVTDYGAAIRRKAERDAAEAMAQQVAEDEAHTPATDHA